MLDGMLETQQLSNYISHITVHMCLHRASTIDHHTHDGIHANILGKLPKHAIKLACRMPDVTVKCTGTSIYRVKVIPYPNTKYSQYEIPK